MSERVSNSCYYVAAADSKSLSVGRLDYEQKRAQREAEATLLPSLLSSVHHGSRTNTLNYSHGPFFMLPHRVNTTAFEEHHWSSDSVISFLLKCFRKSSKALTKSEHKST